mmetsp:Transcript_729/g.1331  ORF Transcript_729/g.1331 Transcript_729/m.1331 type:complete len:975 (-) Transcript_729:86-3010(-)
MTRRRGQFTAAMCVLGHWQWLLLGIVYPCLAAAGPSSQEAGQVHRAGSESNVIQTTSAGIHSQPARKNVSEEAVSQEAAMLLFAGVHGSTSAHDTMQAFGTEATWWGDVSDWAELHPHHTNVNVSGLVHHSAVMWGDDMYVFGGFVNSGDVSKDVAATFRLHMPTLQWHRLNTTGTTPGARDSHTAVVYERDMMKDGRVTPFMIVFGGWDYENSALLSDLWTLNLHTLHWEERDATGAAPPGVRGHSAVMSQNQMVVFGGTTFIASDSEDGASGGASEILSHSMQSNSLFVLDADDWSWTTDMVASGPADPGPPNVTKHSAVLMDSQMIVYGGATWNSAVSQVAGLHDIWVLDLNKYTWTKIYSKDPPDDMEYLNWWGRFDHRAAMHNNEMFVSGGMSFMRRDQSDMCQPYGFFYPGDSSGADALGAMGADTCILTDVIAFNVDNAEWRMVQRSLNPARFGHTMLPFVVGRANTDKLNQWTFGGVCVVVALLVVEALVVMVLKHMSENNTEVSMQLKPYSTLNDHPGDLPTGVDQDGAVVTEKRKKGWGLQALSIPPALRAPFLATMCLVFLCATGLLQEWSENSDGDYPFQVTSAVFVSEFGKLIISVPGLVQQIRSAKNPEDVEKMLAFLPEEFVWYWVPALLFAVKNILSYTVVQQLGAGIARVAAQLKIIFTGVLYDGLARTEMGGTQLRRLSETEWVGLFVLFLAEILAAGEDVGDSGIQVAGLIGAVAMGLAATLGNLSNEVIVKHRSAESKGLEQSVFMQNMILYAYTSLVCLVTWLVDSIVNQKSKNLFHGWDYRTIIVVCFQMASGQIIAFVLKFLDNIIYTVINVVSITATAILASVFFHDAMSFNFILACFFVSLSCYLMYVKKLDKSPQAQKDDSQTSLRKLASLASSDALLKNVQQVAVKPRYDPHMVAPSPGESATPNRNPEDSANGQESRAKLTTIRSEEVPPLPPRSPPSPPPGHPKL